MTQQLAIELCKQAIYTTLLISAPMLIAGLVVGVVVSILQAVTQIHEMTLTFIPKILAVVIVMIMTLPWIMNLMISYTQDLFSMMSGLK
ncbi:MAG: flagellar biosynthesis protein FliQ [bacterium]|nr:flagellar biosynthesis protein FliQ [bacterium]